MKISDMKIINSTKANRRGYVMNVFMYSTIDLVYSTIDLVYSTIELMFIYYFGRKQIGII